MYRAGGSRSCHPTDNYTWKIWHADVSLGVDCHCACDRECLHAQLCVCERRGVRARKGKLGKVTTSRQRDKPVSQAGVDPSLLLAYLVCVQTQMLLYLWDCPQGPAGSPEVPWATGRERCKITGHLLRWPRWGLFPWEPPCHESQTLTGQQVGPREPQGCFHEIDRCWDRSFLCRVQSWMRPRDVGTSGSGEQRASP